MNAPANLKYTENDEWFDPATGKMGLLITAIPV